MYNITILSDLSFEILGFVHRFARFVNFFEMSVPESLRRRGQFGVWFMSHAYRKLPVFSSIRIYCWLHRETLKIPKILLDLAKQDDRSTAAEVYRN